MILFRVLSRFRALFDGDGPSALNRGTTVLIRIRGKTELVLKTELSVLCFNNFIFCLNVKFVIELD